MPRQKKESQPFSIRMDKAVYDKLVQFCVESGQPKTVAIERAVEEYAEKYSGKLKQTDEREDEDAGR